MDEIQNVPELLNYIRVLVDRAPRRTGLWFLTGSQEAVLMRKATESMAGRAAVFQLLPLSIEETRKVSVLNGGFPEVLARPRASDIWFRSYIQTYLERDVRAVSSIRDLATFWRLLALLASRAGQVLNKSELAAPLGVSVPTVSEWINILETTHEILLVPPFYENFGKRIVKSPKLYFSDTGLLCHLLGIDTERMLEKSPFYGAVFENFVASEIAKKQINAGRRREIYYFRDRQGREVDFMVPIRGRDLLILEVKAGRTALPGMAGFTSRMVKDIKKFKPRAFLIYRPSGELGKLRALVPGVQAVSLEALLEAW